MLKQSTYNAILDIHQEILFWVGKLISAQTPPIHLQEAFFLSNSSLASQLPKFKSTLLWFQGEGMNNDD